MKLGHRGAASKPEIAVGAEFHCVGRCAGIDPERYRVGFLVLNRKIRNDGGRNADQGIPRALNLDREVPRGVVSNELATHAIITLSAQR